MQEIASQQLPVTVVNVYDALDLGGRAGAIMMVNPWSSGFDLSLIGPLTYWSHYVSIAVKLGPLLPRHLCWPFP